MSFYLLSCFSEVTAVWASKMAHWNGPLAFQGPACPIAPKQRRVVPSLSGPAAPHTCLLLLGVRGPGVWQRLAAQVLTSHRLK